MADASISIILGQSLLTVDMAHEVRTALHEDTPELVDIEVPNIQARTPVLTGALQSSISGIAYQNDGDDLAFLYASDDEQVAEWGRVYAPYQEGPDLGLSTYTNAPHQMFADVLTDDIPDITAWAQTSVQKGLDRIV